MRKIKHKKLVVFFSICLIAMVFVFGIYQQNSGKHLNTKRNNEQSAQEQPEKEDNQEKQEQDIAIGDESLEQIEDKSSNNPPENNSIATSNSSSNEENINNSNSSSNSSSNSNPTSNSSSNSNVSSSISKNNDTQAEIVETVDKSSIDYSIHKGRIDCSSAEKCDEKGLPIYFQFKKAIRNLFYVEVMSNKNNSMGYFIEYVFQLSIFSTNEECQSYGTNIKNTLSDRVIGYTCTLKENNYELKVYTDYN